VCNPSTDIEGNTLTSWCCLFLVFQVGGSLARAAIRELLAKGLIKPIAESSHQKIYTRAVGQ
jgi:ribosomal protein S25